MTRSPALHGIPEPAPCRPRDGRPDPAPDPERLAAVVARVFLEVETGRRPIGQLERLMTPALYLRLRRTVTATPRCPGPHEVLAVSISRCGPDVCDAAVAVRRGARAGSLALRLERHAGAWRVVELARPEDHGKTYRSPPLIVRR